MKNDHPEHAAPSALNCDPNPGNITREISRLHHRLHGVHAGIDHLHDSVRQAEKAIANVHEQLGDLESMVGALRETNMAEEETTL